MKAGSVHAHDYFTGVKLEDPAKFTGGGRMLLLLLVVVRDFGLLGWCSAVICGEVGAMKGASMVPFRCDFNILVEVLVGCRWRRWRDVVSASRRRD